MGGIFGVASKQNCVFDLFFGIDYHSHLGTRRGGMAVYGEKGFDRSIHNIENSPFRTKFERDVDKLEGSGSKAFTLLTDNEEFEYSCLYQVVDLGGEVRLTKYDE